MRFRVALLVALATSAVSAHEPFQVTTDARALPEALTLHVTMASRTATLACPGVVGAPRSLRAEDLVLSRAGLEACAKGLYAVTSAGRALAPSSLTLALTEEGDLDARLAYPPAPPGPLTLEAVHLARLRDPLYGAELTVTGDGVFLGQALLRAGAPSFSVEVPQSTAGVPVSAGKLRQPGLALRSLLEYFLLALIACALVLLVVRRFR